MSSDSLQSFCSLLDLFFKSKHMSSCHLRENGIFFEKECTNNTNL